MLLTSHFVFVQQIATINNGNYLLAKFFHVAQKVPFLLPIMLLENCDDLSKFLVDIFSKPIICSPTKEKRYDRLKTRLVCVCWPNYPFVTSDLDNVLTPTKVFIDEMSVNHFSSFQFMTVCILLHIYLITHTCSLIYFFMLAF